MRFDFTPHVRVPDPAVMADRLKLVEDAKLRATLTKLARRYPAATIGELYVMAGRG